MAKFGSFLHINKERSSYGRYICHGRKSKLVEFDILQVESPIGGSTDRKPNEGDLGIALGSEI